MQVEATVEVKDSQLQTMLTETSVGYHDELYLNVVNDRVRLLGGDPGASAGTFTDYSENWFESLSGRAEAYINVAELRGYLNLVGSGNMAEMLQLHFESAGEDRLADRLRITPEEGDNFEITVVLPSGRHVIEAVPTGLPSLFSDDNRLTAPDSDSPLPIEIETYFSELESITEAVDMQDGIEYYPIVVRGGELRLDVGDERQANISARLNADVTGSDVTNYYRAHFEEVCGNLSGDVLLNLADDASMAMVSEQRDRTIRHVLGAARE